MKKNFTEDERELIARTVMVTGAFLDEQGLLKKGSVDWACAFCDELGIDGNTITADTTTAALFEISRDAAQTAVTKKMKALGMSSDVIDAMTSGDIVEQIGAVAKAIAALNGAPDNDAPDRGDPDCDCPVCRFKRGEDVSEDELVADAIKNKVPASEARAATRELMKEYDDRDNRRLSIEDIDKMYADLNKGNVH